MSLTFELNEELVKRVEEWDNPVTGHKCTAQLRNKDNVVYKYGGVINNRLEYRIIPTTLGNHITVTCSACKSELVLSNPLSNLDDMLNEY